MTRGDKAYLGIPEDQGRAGAGRGKGRGATRERRKVLGFIFPRVISAVLVQAADYSTAFLTCSDGHVLPCMGHCKD